MRPWWRRRGRGGGVESVLTARARRRWGGTSRMPLTISSTTRALAAPYCSRSLTWDESAGAAEGGSLSQAQGSGSAQVLWAPLDGALDHGRCEGDGRRGVSGVQARERRRVGEGILGSGFVCVA